MQPNARTRHCCRYIIVVNGRQRSLPLKNDYRHSTNWLMQTHLRSVVLPCRRQLYSNSVSYPSCYNFVIVYLRLIINRLRCNEQHSRTISQLNQPTVLTARDPHSNETILPSHEHFPEWQHASISDDSDHTKAKKNIQEEMDPHRISHIFRG